MILTSPQRRALTFITATLYCALLYQWIERRLQPPEAADFSQFEAAFKARLDSIEKVPVAEKPLPSEAGRPDRQSSRKTASIVIVNINTATAAELTTLPGIGEKTALRIIAYRDQNGHFASVRGLLRIKGIGEKTLKKLRKFVRIE